MRWLDGTTNAMYMNLGKLWEIEIERPGVVQSMRSQKVRHDWELNNNNMSSYY